MARPSKTWREPFTPAMFGSQGCLCMRTADLYPVVASKWVLFREPRGGYLRESHSGAPHLTGEIWDLTELAVVILRMSDGTRTAKQILDEIANQVGSSSAVVKSAGDFLVDAVSKGILHLNKCPCTYPVLERGSESKFYPMHLAIELTDKCNLQCRHCYRDSGPSRTQHFPLPRLLSLLSEAHENGVQSIELSGGEPTLHPDFNEILAFTLNHFSAVALLTNGTKITDTVSDLLEQYRNRAFVQIDLDGPTAREHDDLRGMSGSFSKATSAIARLSERGVRVRVAMSLHSGNVGAIEQTYRLACKLGAKLFLCSPVMDVGRATEKMVLSWDQLKESMELLESLAEKDPNRVLKASEIKRLTGKLGTNCGAGSRSIAVGPDGDLRPCFLVNRKLPHFKNVLTGSLNEALDDTPLEFFRALEPPCPAICKDCRYTAYCFGCTARPLLAWERAGNAGLKIECLWAQTTGFSKEFGMQP
jgi:radical SAM protein with 4Fe4S-binding SPASM domain